MSVRSGESKTIEFTTRNGTTLNRSVADSLPTGTLYVNGSADAATVTVTSQTNGLYKAAFTLPTLAIGDVVSLVIVATVNGVTDQAKVWEDTKDVLLDASGDVTFNNTSIATVTTATTVTTLTNLPAIPNNWLTAAGIAANALNGKGDWNVGKTGYSLTQAFPANFAALGIEAGGKVSGVVLVDTTTTNTDMRGTDNAALATQIPADFTDATFASAGVFSVGALANAPTGGGGGGDVNVVSVNGATFAGPNVPCVLADGVAHGGTPGASTATYAGKRFELSHDGAEPALWAHGTAGHGAAFTSGPDSAGLLAQGRVGLWAAGQYGAPEMAVGFAATSAPATVGNVVGSGGGSGTFSFGNPDVGGNGVVASGGPASAGLACFGGQGGNGMELTGTGPDTAGISISHSDAGAFTGVRIQAANGGHDILLAGSGDIWDGAYGRPVQVLSDRVMFTGTLGDQSASPGPYNVMLPFGPTGTDVLLGSRLRITSGSGQDQERTIVFWDGTTQAGIDRPFAVAAAEGDSFAVLYDNAPQLSADGANVAAAVFDLQPQALAQLFTLDTEKVYADAVAGSVVKEVATGAGGSAPTVAAIRTEMDANSTKLAHLDADVSSRSTYAGGDTSGTTTLLSRVTAAVALASQIPAAFTDATFASAGVFSTGALANAPTGGGGGGTDPWATAEPGAYSSGTFGYLVSTDLPAILAKLNAAGSTILIGGTVPDDAGVMKIVRGDGYYLADGTQIGPFTNTSGLAFNTATSFKFRVFKGASQSSGLLTDSDVEVTGSGGAWAFTADLTEAQTTLMTHDQHGWEMVVTLLNGHTRTLTRGTLDLSD